MVSCMPSEDCSASMAEFLRRISFVYFSSVVVPYTGTSTTREFASLKASHFVLLRVKNIEFNGDLGALVGKSAEFRIRPDVLREVLGHVVQFHEGRIRVHTAA